jgi:hypothetical protein
MFRFNFLWVFSGVAVFLITLHAPKARAQETQSSVGNQSRSSFQPTRRTSVSVSYVSWMENVSLQQGSATDTTSATFIGNSISVTEQFFRTRRFGYLVDTSLMLGQADVGGAQNLPYQVGGQSWWGATLSPRANYRLNFYIETSVGAIGLYRNFSFPVVGTTTASSGANFNYGVTGDIRLFLTSHLNARFELGTLLVGANTYWTSGLGYRF